MSRTKDRRALWVSVGLHGFALVLIVGFTLYDQLRKEEPIHVFELVSLAEAPSVANDPPAASVPESQPVVEVPPEIEPLRVEEVEPLRKAPDTPLAPLVKPEPAPAPKPAPAPPPPPKISYEDWARDRKLPEQTQRVQRPPAPQPTPVRIQTGIRDRLRENMSDLQVENFRATSAREQNQMDSYLDGIRSRLRAAFDPMGNDLVARVRFQVAANGAIGRVEIIQSSGNPVFDESVQRTFQKVGRLPPPPSGQGHVWTTTFKSTD